MQKTLAPEQFELVSSAVDSGNPTELISEISRLEKVMLEHAKNLEFEQAAAMRDSIHTLREQLLTIKS